MIYVVCGFSIVNIIFWIWFIIEQERQKEKWKEIAIEIANLHQQQLEFAIQIAKYINREEGNEESRCANSNEAEKADFSPFYDKGRSLSTGDRN